MIVCPHIKIKRAGDESLDLCDLDDRFCVLVDSGATCEVYLEHLEESEGE